MSSPTDWNSKIIAEFRANEGKVGGQFEGAPLLLLHSTGARSGHERVNPMMYRRVGDDYAVFATRGGSPTNPDWFHNLVANPQASIEVGPHTLDVTARVAVGVGRSQIWEAQKKDFPGFADYERRTAREIPVVILRPVG